MLCLSTLALAGWGVLACSLLVMASRRFIKHTKVLWIAPPFGGSLGSSLGHGDEMEVGGEMVDLCGDVLLISTAGNHPR